MDIFKEPLEPMEGVQDFSIDESFDRLKRMKKSDSERFCVVKEERPSFIEKDTWRPLWSIQRRDKMKVLGGKCLWSTNVGRKQIL